METEDGLVGVVVHPRRRIEGALDALRSWAAANGASMGQVVVDGQERRVADVVAPQDCTLLVALGGDGTVLAALRMAAPAGRPVLGVACGSLGALTSVKAPDVRSALDRFAAGDFDSRRLPALSVGRDGAQLSAAFNDLTV